MKKWKVHDRVLVEEESDVAAGCGVANSTVHSEEFDPGLRKLGP